MTPDLMEAGAARMRAAVEKRPSIPNPAAAAPA